MKLHDLHVPEPGPGALVDHALDHVGAEEVVGRPP
jgi:hypothetical protein